MRFRLLRGGVLIVAGLVVMSLSGCLGSDPTATPVTAITATPFPTAVLLPPTATPSATATVSPTEVPVSPTPTASTTATVVPIFEPSPTVGPTEAATATTVVDPAATVTLSSTQTAAPTASATPEPTEVPTVAPTSTATATLVPTPSPTVTSTPTSTPVPIATSTPDPVADIRFVDNEDCEGISRELLASNVITIRDGDQRYLVVAEVADSSGERQQGLMCREVVPDGTGMLFVFEAAQSLNFWMFNTYVPLDIIYLDEERRAVRGVRMEPCSRPEGYEYGQWRSECSGASGAYGSGGAALYALELPAGWIGSLGLDLENLEGVDFSW